MAKRKDIHGAVGPIMRGEFKLTDEQFQYVQTEGRCKLRNKTELDGILFTYILARGCEDNASTRKEQYKELNKAQNAISDLILFICDYQNHKTYGARGRVEDELILIKHKDSVNIIDDDIKHYHLRGITSSQIERRVLESKKSETPLLNFENLMEDFKIWQVAIEKAAAKLTREISSDKGGHEKDWWKQDLLTKLWLQYEGANGKKGAFEKFALAANQTLPKEYMLDLSGTKPGSITKQAKRGIQVMEESPSNKLILQRKRA